MIQILGSQRHHESLAKALEIDTTTLLGLVISAEQHRTPREVFLAAIADAEALGLAATILRAKPKKLEAPRVAEGRETKRMVQALKSQGKTRAQIATELGCSWTAVDRMWSKKS
jgi:hypothetical protein